MRRLLQELLECHVERPSVDGAPAHAHQRGDAAPLLAVLPDPIPEVPAGPDAVPRRDHDSGVHCKFDLTG